MSLPPRSTSTRRAALLRLRVTALFVVAVLAGPAARAEDPAPRWLDVLGEEFDQPLFRPNDDWRARGLAYVDLPLQIRARFDASLVRFRTRPDHLAAPLVAEVGPGLRIDRHIQSRVALTRPLAQGVELEVAWETRNRVESGDPMAFGRQIVGAMIRITP